jgi:hypothetical protein
MKQTNTEPALESPDTECCIFLIESEDSVQIKFSINYTEPLSQTFRFTRTLVSKVFTAV